MGLYGKMAGVAISDYEHARLIVLWGVNPSTSGIHLVPYIYEAQKKGAKLVVIDPRSTPLSARADLHLPVRPGSDLPVALAVARWLFASGKADEKFLREHTTGSDRLRAAADPWTVERAAELAGIPRRDLEEFARLYAESSPPRSDAVGASSATATADPRSRRCSLCRPSRANSVSGAGDTQ